MSILLDAIKITRALLNDDDGLTWADHLVIPKVAQAWGEMLARFQLNGVPVVKEVTSNPILITAGTVTVVVPADMQYPIKLDEYGVNETKDYAIPMTQQDFIPNLQQENTLRYWCWTGQTLRLLGATVDRNVLLYYISSLVAPKRLNDTLTINQSELWLGPRVAALILASTGNAQQMNIANALAEDNFSTILRANVKRMQNLPVRRRPFSYQMKRRNRFYI